MSMESKFPLSIVPIWAVTAVTWFMLIGPWLESLWGYRWGTAFAMVVAIAGFFATFAVASMWVVKRL